MTGRAVDAQAAPNAQVIAVESIAPSPHGTLIAPAGVTGTRRVIYLLAKFADDTDVPHPPSFYLNWTVRGGFARQQLGPGWRRRA